MRPPVKFHRRGNHHLYYGLWFVGFGLFNWICSIRNLDSLIPLWQGIIALGGYLIIDDVIEHTITADTPLRIIYRFLFGVRDHG